MTDFIINFGKTDLLIGLAMLPAIILGFIIYKKDVIEKEPWWLLARLFLFGIIAAGVALLIEIYAEKLLFFSGLKGVLAIGIHSFLIIALVEELIKWLFTFVLCWRRKEFNYGYDAIVYMVFISLGFATIENTLAVLSSGGDFWLIIQRGFITVPAHAFFGIISGYYLGYAKKYYNRNWKKRGRKNALLSIIMPVLAHGLFDFLLFMTNKISVFFVAMFVLYLYVSSFIKVNKVSKEERMLLKE